MQISPDPVVPFKAIFPDSGEIVIVLPAGYDGLIFDFDGPVTNEGGGPIAPRVLFRAKTATYKVIGPPNQPMALYVCRRTSPPSPDEIAKLRQLLIGPAPLSPPVVEALPEPKPPMPQPTPPPEPDASPAEAPAPSSVSEPLPEHGITLFVAMIPHGGVAIPHQVTLPPPEPTMSTSDLVSVLSAAVPAALQLHKVQLDGDAIEGIIDVVSDISKRAARYARRDKLAAHRDSLHQDACDEISCVVPTLAPPVIERIGEIVIDILDEHTDTGPLEEIDGEIAKRGLAALAARVAEWGDSLGNLQARAQRARNRAAKLIEKAERLEALAALKR